MRFFVMIVVTFVATFSSAREWQTVNPLPTQADLEGVAVLASGRRIAVGEAGTILESTGGHPWTLVDSGVDADLNDVVAFGEGAIVVGDSGTVLLRDSWGGWRTIPGFTDRDLHGVAVGPLGVVVVGAGGEIATSPDTVDWVSASVETHDLNAVLWFDDQWVAVGDQGTVASSFGGVEWSVRSVAYLHDLIRISTDGSIVVVLDTTGWTYTSTDARGWLIRFVRQHPDEDSMALAHCGERFHIAMRSIGMATTRTGRTWDRHLRSMHGYDFRDLDCTEEGLVGVGSGGQIAETDGSFLWRGAAGLGGFDLATVAAIPGKLVVGGGDWVLSDVYMGPSLSPVGFVWGSSDGVSWSDVDLDSRRRHGLVTSIASSGDRFLAATMDYHDRMGYRFDLYLSDNGEIWDWVDFGYEQVRSVIWDGARWIAVGGYHIKTSTDGENWTKQQLDPPAWDSNAVASNGTVIVVVADDGRIARSNGNSGVWSVINSPTVVDLRSVVWGHGRFVAVGSAGTVLTSSDGLTWQTAPSGVDADLRAVRSVSGGFAAVGDGGRLLKSVDGLTWEAEIVPPGQTLLDVVEFDGLLHLFGRFGLAVREIDSGPAAPVEASFSWRPAIPEPDQVTRFESHSSSEISSVQWNFGDGSTAEGDVVEHAFSEAGSHTVDIVISGPTGTDAASGEVMVEPRCVAWEPPVMESPVLDPEYGATFFWSHPEEPLFEIDRTSSPSFQHPGPYDGSFLTTSTSFTTGIQWPEVSVRYARVRALRSCPGGYISSDWSNVAVVEFQPRANAPETVQTMVAAAAHTPGVGETFWTTDLVLFNPGPQSATVAVELQGTPGDEVVSSLRLGETLVIRDIVNEMIDGAAVGSLLIGSDEPVIAVSRTGTKSGGGSFGQLIPARAPVRLSGPSSRIIGLTRSGSFRSNLGFASAWPNPIEIQTRFRSADGQTILGERIDDLSPWGHEQVTDVLNGVGTGGDLRGVQAVMNVGDGEAEFIAYASVVDNGTGDPTYFEVAVPPTSGTMLIPSVARVPGIGGSIWRSELTLTDTSQLGSTCEIQWLRRGSDNSDPLTATRALGPGETRVVEDVLDELFGVEGVGALVVECTPGTVAAVSRTFTLTDEGTYGQAVPAQDIEDSFEYGRVGVLPGLSESPDPEQGTRSNLGLVSLCEEPMWVRVNFLDIGGTKAASKAYELRPFEAMQRTRVLASVGMDDSSPVSLTLSSATPGCGFAAWASIVDNRTQDPIFLVASESNGAFEPEDPLAVLNNTDAMLVDRLPQAVGVTDLPSGAYELSVHGSGALGPIDRPLQVLCLWLGPGGTLQAEAMDVGDRAAGIEGDGPVWCVVPDIESCADNSGWMRVDLEGSVGTEVLELDPVGNCVEIDQIPGARYVDPSLANYWLDTESTGDLGRAIDAPVALIIAREEFFNSRRQKAQVVRRGENILYLIDPAYAVVIDWGTASDNRGTFWFEPY